MNTVNIEIDDETKSLQFGEMLTSGSQYKIVIENAAISIGTGSLVLFADCHMSKRPDAEQVLAQGSSDCCAPGRLERVAMCNLSTSGSDVVGTLDLSTDVLIRIAQHNPGAVSQAIAVIHSQANHENVASGSVSIKMIPIATNPTTGAMVLFKGDKGDPGRSIRSISDNGLDDEGRRIVKVDYTDDTSQTFTVPKGVEGLSAKMTAAYCPEDGQWHNVQLVQNSIAGELVLSVSEEGIDLSELPASEKSAVEAKQYADEAKGYRNTASSHSDNAKTYMQSAQTSATTASQIVSKAISDATEAGRAAGQTAGATAGTNAASGYASAAAGSATSAAGSATAAATSATQAAGTLSEVNEAVEAAKSYAESAEDSKTAAQAAAEMISPDNVVHIDGEEDITGVKTFTASPLVPSQTSHDTESEAAVNYATVASMVSGVAGIASLGLTANRTSTTLNEKVATFTGLIPGALYRAALITVRTSTSAGTIYFRANSNSSDAFSSTIQRIICRIVDTAADENGSVEVGFSCTNYGVCRTGVAFLFKISDNPSTQSEVIGE